MPFANEEAKQRMLEELRAKMQQAAGESFSVEDLRRSIRRRMKASSQLGPLVPFPPPAKHPPPAAAPLTPMVLGRLPGRRGGVPKPTPPLLEGRSLTDCVTGREVCCDAGPAWYIETPIANVDAPAARVGQRLLEALDDPGSGLNHHLAALGTAAGRVPDELLFMDIETTGLSSSPLFLIGVMLWEGGELVCRQYLARHYGEEAAVVQHYLAAWRERPSLVTFNGRSFDMPYIRTRAAANGLSCQPDAFHLDLLLVARRLWRGDLPNCRLQTLETIICGREREGDIPGAEIPGAYHDFVRTGDATRMASILHHNLLDLVTLADLMGRLPAPA